MQNAILTSESIAKIAPALVKAQSEITHAVKSAYNTHFKNDYANLRDVIDAVKPALNKNGIALVQFGATTDKPGHFTLVSRLVHESGEWIQGAIESPLQKNDPQGVGSAKTYLRRYSMAAIGCIHQDDDDGNSASLETPAAKPVTFDESVLEPIQQATTKADLMTAHQAAIEVYKDVPAFIARVDAATTARRAALAAKASKTKA